MAWDDIARQDHRRVCARYPSDNDGSGMGDHCAVAAARSRTANAAPCASDWIESGTGRGDRLFPRTPLPTAWEIGGLSGPSLLAGAGSSKCVRFDEQPEIERRSGQPCRPAAAALAEEWDDVPSLTAWNVRAT